MGTGRWGRREIRSGRHCTHHRTHHHTHTSIHPWIGIQILGEAFSPPPSPCLAMYSNFSSFYCNHCRSTTFRKRTDSSEWKRSAFRADKKTACVSVRQKREKRARVRGATAATLVSNHDLVVVVISFVNQESLSPIFTPFIVRV